MDAAGTIIGAVSLGITLCDGIATYCQAWKHQDDDIRSVTELCQTLKLLLQAIEQRVQNSSALDPDIVRKLNNTIQACTAHSTSVLQLASKHTPIPPGASWKEKTKELAQRLKFPFEKQTLEQLKDIMIAFRGNVDTALNLLTIDVSISAKEELASLHAESNLQHQTTVREIRNVEGRVTQSISTELKREIPLLATGLSQNVASLGNSIERRITQSSISASQLVIAEIGQKFSGLESTMTQPVIEHINHSKSSIETTINNSSEEMKSIIGLQMQETMMMRERMKALESKFDEVAAAQRCTITESPGSSLLCPSTCRSKTRRGNQISLANQVGTGCRCAKKVMRFSSSSPIGRRIEKISEDAVIHERNCPLWYRSFFVSKYGVDIVLLQRLRIFGSWTVKGSPYTSLFGWSISHNINYKAVVSDTAPAFKVLQDYLLTANMKEGKTEHPENSGFSVQDCVRDIRAVFESGRGSPYDTLVDGSNLINWVFAYVYRSSIKDQIPLIWELISALLGLGVDMKSTPNQYYLWWLQDQIYCSHSARFPISPINVVTFHAQDVVEFLFWMAKQDIEIPVLHGNMWATINHELRPWHGFKRILRALRSYEDFSVVTECGVLSRAVLRRDIVAAQQALFRNPQLLRLETNLFGHNPIHLAIGWPEGLQLLLGYADEAFLHKDINSRGTWPPGSTPLDYAIAFGCTESIRILANADMAFDLLWNYFIGTGCLEGGVSETLLELFIERLHQLLEYGKRTLSPNIFDSLYLENIGSLDLQARVLLDCLHKEGVQLPKKFATSYLDPFGIEWSPDSGIQHCTSNHVGFPDFWFGFGGLYHQPYLTPDTALAFFQAGFTSIDSECGGYTPLMTIYPPDEDDSHFTFTRYFRMVEFLVTKGARLNRPLPKDYTRIRDSAVIDFQVIHKIASSSWYRALCLNSTEVDFISRLGSSQVWQNIFQSIASDQCVCACTSGGCRPISLALFSTLNIRPPWIHGQYSGPSFRIIRSWADVLNPEHWDWAVQMLEKLAILLGGLEGGKVPQDVIRFLTFSALGISHTCCQESQSDVFYSDVFYHVNVMDTVAVEEIREEEAELIETLDRLVEEFMQEFRELGVSLSEFLPGRWQEKMLAELTKKDEMSETARRNLEELGVRLE